MGHKLQLDGSTQTGNSLLQNTAQQAREELRRARPTALDDAARLQRRARDEQLDQQHLFHAGRRLLRVKVKLGLVAHVAKGHALDVQWRHRLWQIVDASAQRRLHCPRVELRRRHPPLLKGGGVHCCRGREREGGGRRLRRGGGEHIVESEQVDGGDIARQVVVFLLFGGGLSGGVSSSSCHGRTAGRGETRSARALDEPIRGRTVNHGEGVELGEDLVLEL